MLANGQLFLWYRVNLAACHLQSPNCCLIKMYMYVHKLRWSLNWTWSYQISGNRASVNLQNLLVIDAITNCFKHDDIKQQIWLNYLNVPIFLLALVSCTLIYNDKQHMRSYNYARWRPMMAPTLLIEENSYFRPLSVQENWYNFWFNCRLSTKWTSTSFSMRDSFAPSNSILSSLVSYTRIWWHTSFTLLTYIALEVKVKYVFSLILLQCSCMFMCITHYNWW